ncbi:MAG: hypothetical protein PVH61_43330 [Candidatus Aminicenantes bacterium]|jgi:hypothetical protein
MAIQFIIIIQKLDKINPFFRGSTLIFWTLEIYRIPSRLYYGIEEMRVRKFTGDSSKLTERPGEFTGALRKLSEGLRKFTGASSRLTGRQRKFPQASSKLSKGFGKFTGTSS